MKHAAIKDRKEKKMSFAELEPRTFYYSGRCPMPVRLEGISWSHINVGVDYHERYNKLNKFKEARSIVGES
jgi:hypothetical protein